MKSCTEGKASFFTLLKLWCYVLLWKQCNTENTLKQDGVRDSASTGSEGEVKLSISDS